MDISNKNNITTMFDIVYGVNMKKIIVFTLAVLLIATVTTTIAMTVQNKNIQYSSAIVQPVPEEKKVKLFINNDVIDPLVLTLPDRGQLFRYPPIVTLPEKDQFFISYEPPSTLELSNSLPAVDVVKLPYMEVGKRPWWLLPEPVPMQPVLSTSLFNWTFRVMPSPIYWTVAPDPNQPIVSPLPPIIISGIGEINYINLEGGFYGIISSDGKCYDPINLPSEFKNDGLQINYKVKVLPDQVCFHMWGILVEILEIGVMP